MATEREVETRTRTTHTIKVSRERLVELFRTDDPDIPDDVQVFAVGDRDLEDLDMVNPFVPFEEQDLPPLPRYPVRNGVVLTWTTEGDGS